MKNRIKLSPIIKNYIFIGIIGVALLFFVSPYTSPLNPYYGYDSAVFMIMGKGILAGKVPYIDLFDHKGPILYFINALGFQICNGKRGIFLLQCLFFVFSLVFYYKTAILISDKKRTFIALASYMFLYTAMIYEGDMSEEWSLLFIVITLYLAAVRFTKKDSSIHPFLYPFLYGISFGIIAYIRINNAALICGVLLAELVWAIKEKRYRDICKGIFGFLLGVVVVSIPVWIYFIQNNAVKEFLWGTFGYNILYAEKGTDSKSTFDIIKLLFNMSSLIFIALMSVHSFYMKRDLFAILLFCESICGVIVLFMGFGYWHYYLLAVPLMALIYPIIYRYYSGIRWHRGIAAIGLLLLILPFSYQFLRNIGKNYMFDFKKYYDADINSVNDVMKNIPESEHDSIWGYNIPAHFYMYADVVPCYKYFVLQDFQSESASQIKYEINDMLDSRNTPKWIIINNTDKINNEKLNRLLSEKYRYVMKEDSGIQVKVYQREY